jgi:mannose-6-phosphate isomerase-like protein (cupin superfamily)
MMQMIMKGWEIPAAPAPAPVARNLKVLFSPELNGYEKATVLFSIIPPGSASGVHAHTDCDEIMYFMGQGVATLGETTVAIEKDLVILAQQGVPHSAVNTSDSESLKIFCVYLPAIAPTALLAEAIEKSRMELSKRKQTSP